MNPLLIAQQDIKLLGDLRCLIYHNMRSAGFPLTVGSNSPTNPSLSSSNFGPA
jgi:hypothetical protein